MPAMRNEVQWRPEKITELPRLREGHVRIVVAMEYFEVRAARTELRCIERTHKGISQRRQLIVQRGNEPGHEKRCGDRMTERGNEREEKWNAETVADEDRATIDQWLKLMHRGKPFLEYRMIRMRQ